MYGGELPLKNEEYINEEESVNTLNTQDDETTVDEAVDNDEMTLMPQEDDAYFPIGSDSGDNAPEDFDSENITEDDDGKHFVRRHFAQSRSDGIVKYPDHDACSRGETVSENI